MSYSFPSNKDLESKLNFESESFDPLEALNVEEGLIKLPVENAKLFQNLDEYEKRSFPKKSNVQQKCEKKPEEKELKKSREMPYTGGFNLPVLSKPRKDLKDVLTRMNQNLEGPFSLLSKSIDKRIKVFLRRRKLSIDNCDTFATLFGHLIAFDHHCNIILKDVQEFVKILSHDKLKIKKSLPRERILKSIFIRGSNVILVSLLN